MGVVFGRAALSRLAHRRAIVGAGCHTGCMFDVRAALAGVPRENVGVPWDQFTAAWERAEQLAAENGPADGYACGMVLAFRWLGRSTLYTPVTRRESFAMPETIGPELIAANTRIGRPARSAYACDVARGTADVLGWVWETASRPPALGEPGHRASTGSAT